jgi:hypothetical protein
VINQFPPDPLEGIRRNDPVVDRSPGPMPLNDKGVQTVLLSHCAPNHGKLERATSNRATIDRVNDRKVAP